MSKIHVLYVDDDPVNLEVFREMCEDDFPCLTATSVADAKKLLEQHEVGVLLSDQRMPGESGIELLAHAKETHPKIVRLMITAYSDIDAAVEAINRGAVSRYLRKPWDPIGVRADLIDALSMYKLNQLVDKMEKRLVHTERLYSLGVVSASIAHELRNPVSWITNNVQFAIRFVKSAVEASAKENPDMESLREALRQVQSSMKDVMEGSDRVFDIVRGIELPSRAVIDTEVDLAEVVRLSVRMCSNVLTDRVHLKLHNGPWPVVRGTRTGVGQIIVNLINNAYQAASENTEGGVVDVVVSPAEKDFIYLSVIDNGCGIEKDIFSKIFDPFFTTRGNEGGGLGLAISRRIAQEMGGDLTAENAAGSGACFKLKLPLVRWTERDPSGYF